MGYFSYLHEKLENNREKFLLLEREILWRHIVWHVGIRSLLHCDMHTIYMIYFFQISTKKIGERINGSCRSRNKVVNYIGGISADLLIVS